VFKANIKTVLTCALCLLLSGIKATHIVGGEMYYDYLGNNQYRITLKLYRDCLNGQAPFGGLGDGHAILNITGYNKELVSQVLMGEPLVTPVPANNNNPCMQSPNGVCVEQGVYTRTVNLPPRPGGYFLVYETCCRNNTILNILNPGNQGSTYRIYIPGPELAAVNSSPRFNQMPSLYVCSGAPLNYLHSAIDPDGDSLVYSFAPAYNGFNIDTLVPYMAPFNGSYPMASNPQVSISGNNGFISGVPTILGQWALCVMVKEYRNGKLLSTHYRDFQYNVISCNLNVSSSFANQTNKCEGAAISFTNQSFSNFGMTYFWDFGVASITTDTSSQQHPSFNYPDTGTYTVKLIVNKGLPCADSIIKNVYVYPAFQPVYSTPATNQCIKQPVVQFSVGGTYLPQASFQYAFGNQAIPVQASVSAVTVTYNAAGNQSYTLIAKQYVCSDTIKGTIKFYERPVPVIEKGDSVFCAPAIFNLKESSESEYPLTYIWHINNNTYIGASPIININEAGTYSTHLVVYRQGVCADTVHSSPFTFTVHPLPLADFILTPSITSIFDPEIEVNAAVSGDVTEFLYNFGDGFTSVYMNEKHRYAKPGNYSIQLNVKNQFGCESSIRKQLSVEPEFRFWIPNTFTPDENGLNDVFKPILIGIKEYSFTIFNRFGEVIFSSTDIQEGWNGYYKNTICEQGTYSWKISYTNELTQKFESKTGQVFLLR
jgi:gliding motility-associated-like protein